MKNTKDGFCPLDLYICLDSDKDVGSFYYEFAVNSKVIDSMHGEILAENSAFRGLLEQFGHARWNYTP